MEFDFSKTEIKADKKTKVLLELISKGLLDCYLEAVNNENSKIAFIRALRNIVPGGLKDSKDFVDGLFNLINSLDVQEKNGHIFRVEEEEGKLKIIEYSLDSK